MKTKIGFFSVDSPEMRKRFFFVSNEKCQEKILEVSLSGRDLNTLSLHLVSLANMQNNAKRKFEKNSLTNLVSTTTKYFLSRDTSKEIEAREIKKF